MIGDPDFDLLKNGKSDIANEEASRKQGDSDTLTSINQEENQRKAADANLQEQIDAALGSASNSDVKIYMTATGQKLGLIQGSSTDSGHEDQIEVLSYSHKITSPRDAASGLPTGKRQHTPIVITKEIDKSTPLLLQALTANENLISVDLDFYKPDPSGDGTMQHYFSVHLTNANIATTLEYPPDPGHDDHTLESISFTYQKIQWTWADGGITAQDDWEAPTV